MDFDELIAPMSNAEFDARFDAGECFVISGPDDKFERLATLDEIEACINDATNRNIPLEVIRCGERFSLIDEDVPWAMTALRKREVRDAFEAGHSFLMRNMSELNARVAKLIDSVEERFRHLDVRADMHLYVSPTHTSTGYDAHRDRPQHKLYLQVIGSTAWQVFAPRGPLPTDLAAVRAVEEPHLLSCTLDFTLSPGDLFYMPPDTFHKVRNLEGPRVSFSIPFHGGEPSLKRVDRTHIPFRELFERELGKV